MNRIAASNENSIIKMIQWERRNSGSFDILNDPSWTRDIYSVEARRLDDLIGHQRVHVVKIDGEGAEGLFLQGMLETIKREQPILFIGYITAVADEAERRNRFLPGYVIENVDANESPELSHIFYFKTQIKNWIWNTALLSLNDQKELNFIP